MLNYPFPYDSLPVIKQYKEFAKALYKTVKQINSKYFHQNLKKYKMEREKFKRSLSKADYKYFSFQIWQEGIARHTEHAFLELLDKYNPSPEIQDLEDFETYHKLKTKMLHTETMSILKNKLEKSKRVCFYSIGFAEGLLLDTQDKSWRTKYLKNKFFIETHFNMAKE